jgi:Na+-transporting methylmalonyl-CoA/oxaloacetate decarboxylase gamma subunit
MLMLANALGNSHLGVGSAALYSLLGYAVVFLGLFLLMIVVATMGKAFVAADNRKKKKEAAAAPVQVEAMPVETPQVLAPGTAGELKLHDVEPKTAAMLMAIVANQMGKPLNELRFISIKEVK